jgi:hypothetical protein
VGDPLPEIFRGGDDPPEDVKRSSRLPLLFQCIESIKFIRSDSFSAVPP